MPTFCRHNRLEATCPICSKRSSPAVASSPPRRQARPATAAAKRHGSPRAGDLRVRRLVRAADDGYAHELVPGVHASVDAARLADELAFATARLRELEAEPPGLYAEAGSAADPEEGCWLAFLIVYLSPLERPDPFATIERVRTSWAGGELPLADDAATGPRAAYHPARAAGTLTAYRAWAARAGSQVAGYTGEASWPPPRRFERAFERLAIPGLHRAARYELLVLVGRLGLVDLRPWSLHLVDPTDPTTIAAKRVFAIGDAMNLQRRASDLATGAGVPIEALDLALRNWGAPAGERVTAGALTTGDEALRARIRSALGLPPD